MSLAARILISKLKEAPFEAWEEVIDNHFGETFRENERLTEHAETFRTTFNDFHRTIPNSSKVLTATHAVKVCLQYIREMKQGVSPRKFVPKGVFDDCPED